MTLLELYSAGNISARSFLDADLDAFGPYWHNLRQIFSSRRSSRTVIYYDVIISFGNQSFLKYGIMSQELVKLLSRESSLLSQKKNNNKTKISRK